MGTMRHICRELRGPLAGLTILALVISLFASGLVASARAAISPATVSHCLSAGTDIPTPDGTDTDALCNLCCAIGLSAMVADAARSPATLAPVRYSQPFEQALPLGIARASEVHGGGGGSRAPPAALALPLLAAI